MDTLGTLDRLIAVVVVLLLLSLLVQSIQGIGKQLLRFKSRQLQESLLDLFAAAQGEPNAGRRGWLGGLSSVRLPVFALEKKAGAETKRLVAGVLEQFRQIGRLTVTAGNAIESLSKEDLLKVVGRVAPDLVVKDLGPKLQAASRLATDLKRAVEAVQVADLPAESSAAYARIRDALAPVLGDFELLLQNGQLRTDLLIDHVLRLRAISIDDVLTAIGGVQKLVAEQLAKTPANAALVAVDAELKKVVEAIVAMQKAVVEALSPLRSRLQGIAGWYDTVMQGFEERYQRSMRAWTFAIGLVLVGALDVSLLEVYRSSAASPSEVQRFEKAADELKAKIDAQAAAGAVDESTAQALDEINERRAEIAADLDMAATLGLGWHQQWVRDEHGQRLWLPSTGAILIRASVAWLPAALLIGLGAPFWHDLLESLFGIKRLVRKRAETRNVEQESGAGNPKP